MSEEEKAIETLKEVASDDFDTLGDDISPKMAQSILNVINKQQKELDFYKKEELGYITGYEDGKRHKQTAVAIKNENAQQELFQKEIARLKEIIERQQDEIDTWEETENDYEHELARKDEEIENQQKEIEELKNNELDYTTIYMNGVYDGEKKVKDKIREIIAEYQKQLKSADTERTAIMLSNFIMVLNDLLEESQYDI